MVFPELRNTVKMVTGIRLDGYVFFANANAFANIKLERSFVKIIATPLAIIGKKI